jgi:hypothetical protein
MDRMNKAQEVDWVKEFTVPQDYAFQALSLSWPRGLFDGRSGRRASDVVGQLS